MSALAGFGYQVAVKGLVTQGNAAKTATDVMAHQGLFRFGVLSLILVVVIDVVVAWALYRVFNQRANALSMLAAWLRIVYAGIFAVAITQLVEALRLLDNAHHFDHSRMAQANAEGLARINTFGDIWDAGLVLFGFHLLLIAYLAYRSSFVPNSLPSCSPSPVSAICSTASAGPQDHRLTSPRSLSSASSCSRSGS